MNKIVQSNLGPRRRATDGRPTHSRRTQSFNRIRQCVRQSTRRLRPPDLPFILNGGSIDSAVFPQCTLVNRQTGRPTVTERRRTSTGSNGPLTLYRRRGRMIRLFHRTASRSNHLLGRENLETANDILTQDDQRMHGTTTVVNRLSYPRGRR